MDNNSQNIIHATPELPKISTLTNASFECHILSVTELTELNETRGKSVQQMDLKTFPLPCPGPFDIEHSQRTSSSVALENWKFLIRRLQEKKKEKQLRNFYWRQSQQVQHISEDRQLVQQAVVAWKENPEVQRRLSVSSTNDDVSVVVNTLEAPNCPNDQKPKVARSPKAHSEVTDTNSSAQRAEVKAKLLRADRRLALLMFFLNLALLGAKIAACILSNSLTIISSAVDSAVDLLSSLVVWLSTRAVRRHDQYKFPRGRSRLEPLTIIAMSIIRGAAGFLIIEQSAVKMLTSFNVTVELSPLIIMGLTVALKLVAAIFCYLRKTPNARLFAMDNRNDCISNGFAIICAFIGNKFWIYADPIGAILVSIYIIVSEKLISYIEAGGKSTIFLASFLQGQLVFHRKKSYSSDKRTGGQSRLSQSNSGSRS